MSIKLNEARQKKADELGLPFTVRRDEPEDRAGYFLDRVQNKFSIESANRVLQLEQAVEGLRHMLEKCQLCDAEGFTWSAAHETAVGELLQQTEADHE